MSLQDSIDSFVQRGLDEHTVPKIRDDKIFHDPLRGTQKLYKHEVALIDTIFVQRLKRVHQTGFACQVYPSATHTRFEHSLGTLFFATRMFNSIMAQYPDLCSPDALRTIRMAALLHDIGSLPFSHSSEIFIRSLSEIQDLKKDPLLANCKAHEILSFLILHSKPFQDFLNDEIAKKYMVGFDREKIPLLVVGTTKNPGVEKFQADIINGTFDSDKLDYITRDSYYTGLPMSVDIDRLMQSLTLPEKDELKQTRLMVDIKGIPCLEQMLFNKIYLFSSVYHHHKIRAIECMLTNMYDLAYSENRKFDESILRYDDCSVFGYFYQHTHSSGRRVMKKMISSLQSRRLFMRSLVFSPQTIEERTRVDLQSLTKKAEA
ncbi:HD domain-containing protein, partial [Candidatus Bathyarchaeota archaeon]|nr:HD domain-containing protein [Candidatus Bathyarchaeota archaeon]